MHEMKSKRIREQFIQFWNSTSKIANPWLSLKDYLSTAITYLLNLGNNRDMRLFMDFMIEIGELEY